VASLTSCMNQTAFDLLWQPHSWRGYLRLGTKQPFRLGVFTRYEAVETIRYSVGGGALGFHLRMRIPCAPPVKHRSCGRRHHGPSRTSPTGARARPPRSQLARAATDEISRGRPAFVAAVPELPRRIRAVDRDRSVDFAIREARGCLVGG
jgi:hypothetical protein